MTKVIKRDGTKQSYEPRKIKGAIASSFKDLGLKTDEEFLVKCLSVVEEGLGDLEEINVETIQDSVEKAVMKLGEYEVAKNYILYRERRTKLRETKNDIVKLVNDETLLPILDSFEKEYPDYNLEKLEEKYTTIDKENITDDERLALLIRSAEELTSKEEPKWEMISGRLFAYRFHKNLKEEEKKRDIGTFYKKLVYLTKLHLYGDYISNNYSENEIEESSKLIDDNRDKLFNYAGIDLLTSRYVISDHQHVALESPQEMYLGIALHLAMLEDKAVRLKWVEKFYDMLSKHLVTMATPTMSNARKPYPQLSSCFINTVPDSLDGIYRSITSFSKISKFGGGMGLYLGHIRSRGSTIRGFEGASGGVIRWARLINDTAVAVDQLGVRQGAVAIYLDARHKDLPEFLQLRTNNGDERMKAHDVFPGVCYPDLFRKKVKEDMNQEWYLLDPHQVLTKKGYRLEDYYGEEWEKRYLDCVNDPTISKRVIIIKDLIRLIITSAVETGTPFAFYRDTVNRMNPNKHKGMIYCSNLCTEIAQNMSETSLISEEITVENGEKIVVEKTLPGDFVVCNLASLCLGNIEVNDSEKLGDVVSTVVRALDNVISLNFYPLPYAKLTNEKYRSIGLGISGYHHMLAKNNIPRESERHLEFVDKVFEEINYAAIHESMELAKERGYYAYFKGSEWDDGTYFKRRNYASQRWLELAREVHQNGLRNAYLIAIAPTSSTSILADTTAGLDPTMKRFYLEEKKGFMLPRVAPDLSIKTYRFYKDAAKIDQSRSVRAAGVRQKHIDQSASVNLWITTDYTMRQILNLYILAWESGVKTIYYVRSQSLVAGECESCQA
jgi:ribonucleoside-diphosphate reductase alpha chain